jgi:hypothetical protein
MCNLRALKPMHFPPSCRDTTPGTDYLKTRPFVPHIAQYEKPLHITHTQQELG